MKKRVLSMLLAFILCFSTLPMTAFAQDADVVTEREEQQEADSAEEQEKQQEADSAEEQEEQQEAVPVTEQKKAEAAAHRGEETPSDKSTTAATPGTEDPTAGEAPDTVEPTAESVSDSDAGTQDTAADDEKKAAVQKVQALIDALPETVTVENAESVSAQLEAIDEAMESLTEEQIAELDMTRLHAVSEAMSAPMTVAEGEHTHFLCGKDTCNRVGGHTETNKVTFKAWKGTSELPEVVGNYYLMNNVTLNEAWTPVDGVVLCLNGHTITVEAKASGITVGNGKTFTLCDCAGSGKITHGTDNNGDKYDGRGVDVSNGTFNMYGGSITDNKAFDGVGVGMKRGTFNMYGGNITENKTGTSKSTQRKGTDGGVSVGEHSIFNMYAGTISGNEGANGGGVGISKGTFNMSGGTIESNGATVDEYNRDSSGYGGGVCIYVTENSMFNMSGGIIKNNRAAYGGGVFVGSTQSFNMTGGEITGNIATVYGGGVYVYSAYGNMGHFTVSGSAKVFGNNTSNVYLPDGATMTIDKGGFDNAANIGVTTENLPTPGSYVAIATGAANGGYRDDAFINDQNTGGCKFQQVGDQILLVNGTLHQHPICGKTCSHDGEHTDEAWKGVSSLSEITTGGYYYLTKDIDRTQTWNLPNDKVVLCLNGHNITANANVDVIKTSSYAQFILTDCMGEKTEYGKITHKEGKVGRGIYVNSSFTMYGGEISGNTIDASASVYGGGVYVDYGSFTMHGGSITNNKISETMGNGGGVFVSDHGSFTMDGGSITDNRAPDSGGGVYSMVDFIVSGKAIITNNTAMDGQTANNARSYETIKVDADGLDDSTAKIGVTTSQIAEGSYAVVAEGTDSYSLSDTDLSRFSSDAGYTRKLVDNRIVFINGTPHEHPICGKTDCNDDHSNVLWNLLTYDADTKQLKYGATTAKSEKRTNPTEYYVYTLPAGNYYLAQDITLEGSISISGDVNICLNGYEISTNQYNKVFAITNYKLAVCDCSTSHSGKIRGNHERIGEMQPFVVYLQSNASFDLYGGTICGGDYGVYENMASSVTLFGGSITDNTYGVDGSDNPPIKIGGDAKVINNTKRNLFLRSNQVISIDDSLTQDARIGISTVTEPSANNNIQIATSATNDKLNYSKIFTSDATDQNYVVTKDANGNLYLGIHQHNWQATAKDDQITFTCNATGCNLRSDFATTYTVTAPTDLTYSGSEKVATVTTDDKYSDDLGLPTRPAITYQELKETGYVGIEGAPKNVGTYQASITIDNVIASVTYHIVSRKVTNPTITVAGTYTYDGTEKKPSVVVKDGETEIPDREYSVSYADNINVGTATVTITDVDGGNYNVSGSTTFTIDKATITVTPTAGQTTIYGMSDPTLEYSSSGAMAGETPDFTGALSRKAGKDAGSYEITRGTLKLADNDSFKAANYELKLADTLVQFTIVPKTLSAEDLEFITDSPITKQYDGTIECTTAKVKIKDRAKADPNDEVPTVTGTYAYNSENVTEANKVTFTSDMTSNTNYILPKDLKLEHEASITKANQAALTITSTSAIYGTNLQLTVNGGSGDGALTYAVVNDTGAATISGSTLQPVRAGQVTVQATKAGDDNHNEVKSFKTVITINKGTYPGTASKTINLIKGRSDAQTGTLTAGDFFPEGAPEGAVISAWSESENMTMLDGGLKLDSTNNLIYTSGTYIASADDQKCTVTISSDNYHDITATLIFHLTDKKTVTISGLTYTGKTYDGKAMKPVGTLTVSDDKVPVSELEVTYTGIGDTTYNGTDAPTDAGTYQVIYKVREDNDNYIGEKTYTFTISPKAVTADMIGAMADETYTGSPITPQPVVMDGNTILTSGTDFDFSYYENINAGAATLTITGQGNYTGTASRTFTINPKDIKGAAITLQADSLVYTGLMQEVQITSVILGQVELTANDYDIVKGSNKRINADDSITLTIAGKGNYTGTATTTWEITKATPVLDNFVVTPDLSTEQTYDGNLKAVTVQTKDAIGMGDVKVYYEGSTGTDYTKSETAPVNAGTYQVTLEVSEGTNYNAAQLVVGTMKINKAVLTLENIEKKYGFTESGEQTISIAGCVPDATGYTLGTVTGNTEIISGASVDQDGNLRFTLNEGKAGKKLTLPVTISSANYKDTTVDVVIIQEYRIIDGANSSWTQNTDGTIVIRGNGAYRLFREVKVDGNIIDAANYEVKEGSTIITLKAEYLKTLAAGSHTFEIVWNDGSAGTDFTVVVNTPSNNGSSNNDSSDSSNTTDITAPTAAATAQELDKVPATGDPFGIWLTLFAISLTGLAGMLARRKKN